ncbi:MAG: TIGR00730 family Rossman fold protein [Deltaproteobacteria bacterium]|jgi:uncharacterized protein (TIGR00730 family)
MKLNFKENNGQVDEIIAQLIELAGDIHRPQIVREMILASLKAGQEDEGQVDLKLMNTSLKEMRYTAKVFRNYRDIRKVTAFGSARTLPSEPIYRMARDLGRKLAQTGYMVINGGGPGIMQAVNEGAGPDRSFAVKIQLPFERKPTSAINEDSKVILYKYFFNRKVAFLKESDAAVLFPGGFGTLDEAMETLTLVQTGKRNPLPIILVDEPGGSYWENWIRFVKKELLAKGYIGESDLKLFERVDAIDDAVAHIARFYRRYHSLRYVGDQLLIRLNSEISKSAVEALKRDFSDMLNPGGDICLSGPFPEEMDETDIKHLPRLVVDFNRCAFGRFKEFIDAVNDA